MPRRRNVRAITSASDIAAEFASPTTKRNAGREAQLAQNLMLTRHVPMSCLFACSKPSDYARLTNPGPVELSDVRAQLAPGEALLSFVGRIRGKLWAPRYGKWPLVKRLDVASKSLATDIAFYAAPS